MLLTSTRNRPALRANGNKYKMLKVRGIVIHWTANTHLGANAMANRNYFNSVNNVFASAHYVVDDKGVVQCIPDNEVAFHVGDKPRLDKLPLREVLLEGQVVRNPNFHTIGVEMCVNRDGDWAKTYEHTVKLVRELMDKHGLTVSQVYRHYDITGKDCPRMFMPVEIEGKSYSWYWNTFKYDLVKEDKVVERVRMIEVPVEKIIIQRQSFMDWFKGLFNGIRKDKETV